MAWPEAISVSQINLYRTCSLKYRFQYIDLLPRMVRPAGMVFGSAVHAALEWLHKARKAGEPVTLGQLLRIFEADWEAQIHSTPVSFGTDQPAESLVLKGKELLSSYFHLPAPPVGDAELFFQLPLVNPVTGEVLDVPLKGIIDLIEADGTVVEFKTSLKRWAVSELPDNLQLTAYSYAYEMLFGHPPRDVKLVNLVRTKSPVIETHITGRDAKDYERFFSLAKEVVRAVRAGIFFPNRGCWMCRDCEYDQDCREWTGNAEPSEGS